MLFMNLDKECLSVENPNPPTCSNECTQARIQTIKTLASCGTNFNVEDSNGLTPLHVAVSRNDGPVIRALIECGADVNYKTFRSNGSILHFAALTANLDTVSLLLALRADARYCDSYGRTVLHSAAAKGRLDVMKLCSQAGADIHCTDYSKISPLHLAAWYDNEDIIEWCLQQGLSANLKDQIMWTPLHYAAESGRKNAALFLLKNGAHIHSKDVDDYTPLFWARYYRHKDIVDLLTSWSGFRLHIQKFFKSFCLLKIGSNNPIRKF